MSFNLHIEGCVEVAGKDPLLVGVGHTDTVHQSRDLITWGLHQLDLLKSIAVCDVGWKAYRTGQMQQRFFRLLGAVRYTGSTLYMDTAPEDRITTMKDHGARRRQQSLHRTTLEDIVRCTGITPVLNHTNTI